MMRHTLTIDQGCDVVNAFHGGSRVRSILRVVRGLFARGTLPYPVEVVRASQVVEEGTQLDLILGRLHAARAVGGSAAMVGELARLEQVLQRRFGREFQPRANPQQWLDICHKYDFDGCADG